MNQYAATIEQLQAELAQTIKECDRYEI